MLTQLIQIKPWTKRSPPIPPRKASTAQTADREAYSNAQAQVHANASRRNMIGMLGTLAAMLGKPLPSEAAPQGNNVGGYLPKAGVEDFVQFVPDKGKTPSIRAGTIDVADAYRFALPPSWKEERVANILSGNFCQPRCDEPWTEVIFADAAEGKATLIVSPLRRLTNKASATIDQIGSPSGVLAAVGPFITGTSPPDEEEVVSAVSRETNGRKYYVYEANALGGTIGPHTLTACTTKGELIYIFILSATDRQWGKSQKKLKKVVDTFQV